MSDNMYLYDNIESLIADFIYHTISEINEAEWYAGWMDEIEYRVWFDAHNPHWNREYPVENVEWKMSIVRPTGVDGLWLCLYIPK
jgi:hypothetical protein